MIKIGLTGGIGTGKSYISLIFNAFNIPIYNSDIEAKKLYYNDDVKEEMKTNFGNQVYLSTGEINKEFLSELIFNDKNALEKINSIIHPRVKSHFSEWIKLNNTAHYIIKESAILFESGAYKQTDKIIVVTAPLDIRIKRIKARDNITEKIINKKINNQLSQSELIKNSDFIIVNDEKQALLPQISKLHETFTNLNK